jgi:20S proteasome alpha/beta subunit
MITVTKVREYFMLEARSIKAMTVAVGLWCDDGLVFCTDSQITVTGGLKYPAKKIFNYSYRNWAVSMAYSGSPEMMGLIDEKFYGEMLNPKYDDDECWEDNVRSVIEKVLHQVIKKHKRHHIELLCGTMMGADIQGLWRTQNTLVVDAEIGECIGVGDSSVLRFISDVLVQPRMTITEGIVIACYMVSKAITYIDGCDGPLQATVLADGKYYELDMDKFGEFATLEPVEKALRNLFFDISGQKKTQRLWKESLARFRDDISKSDWASTIKLDSKESQRLDWRPGLGKK